MTLFLNNDDVAEVLTMEDTIAALEESYSQLVRQEAVCRTRIDLQIQTSYPGKVFNWGTIECGSFSG